MLSKRRAEALRAEIKNLRPSDAARMPTTMKFRMAGYSKRR